MVLKIEGSSEDLLDFQKFCFEKDKDIALDEEFAQSPGYHKEPLVIALVVALTPITRLLIREYFKYRRAKLKAENERLKVIEEARKTEMVLSIKEGKDWRRSSEDEIDSIDLG